MTTTRRGFLKLLGVGAAAAVAPAIILPERRIWAVGFGSPRDVHGALGVQSGTYLATMQRLMEEQADHARRDREELMQGLLKQRYGDPSSLRELRAHIAEHDRSLAMRIGSQDLTFERPSEETLRLWRDAPEANVPGVLTREAILDVGRTYTATLTGVIASHAAKRA